MKKKGVSLTGDRPTGCLHLGHYVGSLVARVAMQKEFEQYVMVADAQALTDNFDKPEKIRANVLEVVLDYLAVGIDPNETSIFIQSELPELPELTMYYLNVVTWNRLQHNPTLKSELKQKGYEKSSPAGFMIYPAYQVADITAFRATHVPVGEDQLPMVELTCHVARRFNEIYRTKTLIEPEAVIPKIARLPGTDGKAKMSKSVGNCIYLSDPEDKVIKKVRKMYTDPDHLTVDSPGKVEGNPVFSYLDAFGTDTNKIEDLKAHYQRGGLADSEVKKYLTEVLLEVLEPIRKKREELAKDPHEVMNIVAKGTQKAREKASETLALVKKAMHLDYDFS